MKKVRLILDNVRSAHNVGSIFRTADAAGVEKLYLLGITPAPIDRFGRVQPEISKTSLGASEIIAWEAVNDVTAVEQLTKLREEGFSITVVEQAAESNSIYDFTIPDKVCYVFGNEIAGVREEIIALADSMIEIPMQGQKESLNVSVTTGIVLFMR